MLANHAENIINRKQESGNSTAVWGRAASPIPRGGLPWSNSGTWFIQEYQTFQSNLNLPTSGSLLKGLLASDAISGDPF